MEIDQVLVEKMLNVIEKADSQSPIYDGGLQIEGYSAGQIIYHLDQLIKSHAVNGEINYADNRPTDYVVIGLNPEGHALLKAMRDDKIGPKIKKFILSAGGAGGGLVISRAIEMALDHFTKNIR